jgi:hypothetical protein
MVHTMTDNPLKEELLNYPHKDYTFNIAEKHIKEHWENVLKVRERNIRETKGLIIKK